MKILFTICARKGSKGVKNKNISDLLGYPLCFYALSAYDLFIKNYPDITCELAVNTDSAELVEQIKSTKTDFTYVRRADELAGDRVGKIDVIKNTYLSVNKDFDYVIDLDLTSPLRRIADIKGVLDKMVENKNADLCFSVAPARRSPFFNQVEKKDNGFYDVVKNSGFVSRQQATNVYDINGSIYVYKPEFLIKAKYLFDGNTLIYEMKDTAVLDIDEPEDKELLQVIAKYFFEQYEDYNEIFENIKNIIY